MGIMEIEAEMREIKELLTVLNRKLDLLMENREALSVMRLAEGSLKAFFEAEPVLYALDDLRVRYR